MPTQAVELEAPPQEEQREQPAAEETLAGPAGPIPPSDTPHDASPVETTREPATKPQGVTDEAWRKLNSKQKGFVAAYVQDGNALNAYLSAGYVQNRNGHPKEWIQRRAYQVRKGKAVVKALLEYQEQRAALAEARKDFALDWIVSEHERLMKAAEVKGDLAVATRNLELIGRTRGVYADNVLVDLGQRRQYSESERLEAARLSRLALLDGMGSTGGGGDSEEHTSDPITSSALPAPPSGGDGDGHARDEGEAEG